MDLTQDVTYPSSYGGGAISLNNAVGVSSGSPLTGRSIDKVEWQPVVGVGYVEKRAQDAGNDASDVFDGPMRLHLTGTQYGATAGALAAEIRMLRSTFSPQMAYKQNPSLRGYLALTFHERDYEGNGTFTNDDVTMILYCRPVAGVSIIETKNDSVGDSAKGGAVVWSVVLEARDPRRYNATAKTASVATGTSGTLALTNNGDRPAPVTVTLTVPSPGKVGSVHLTGLNNGGLTITTEVAGNRTYVLGPDHLLYVTEAGQTTLRMDLLTCDAEDWPTLAEATGGSISWSATSLTSGTFTLALSMPEAFA